MIGIYHDNIIDYLKDNLGGDVTVNNRNIICRCPYCDVNRLTSKNHLWISLETPIFNCFRAGCPGKSGGLKKLFTKINGSDNSNLYFDRDLLKQNANIFIRKENKPKQKISIPNLYPDSFPDKKFYLTKRFKFSNIDLHCINGLVFDIIQFLNMNHIKLDPNIDKMKNFFQSNFIGFLTEHRNILIMRNIAPNATFRYFKLQINRSDFIDYYKVDGNDKNSNHIVLSEGIFDIYPVALFNLMDFNDHTNLYSSVLSSKFAALIKSICFYEDLYRLDVSILSDDNVDINYYKKIKRFNSHIINTLIIYYNKNGKDFNDTPLNPVKIII